MDRNIFFAVLAMGIITMGGVIFRMKNGFGPFNLRAVGLIFVGTIAALLGLKDSTSLNAAMGILGAIAGYLFGIKDED